jgi:hypothetical protein
MEEEFLNPEDLLDLIDESNLDPHTTIGAITDSDSETYEVVLKLKPCEFTKLNPDKVNIVQLTW